MLRNNVQINHLLNLLLPPSHYEPKVSKTLSALKKYKFALPFSSKSWWLIGTKASAHTEAGVGAQLGKSGWKGGRKNNERSWQKEKCCRKTLIKLSAHQARREEHSIHAFFIWIYLNVLYCLLEGQVLHWPCHLFQLEARTRAELRLDIIMKNNPFK